MNDQVRVRFCPSPTGNPHVGMIRTALFNWAFARHTKGTLVFRIEDTDAARDSEESYQDLLAALRWLHLDWDEGPEVGGEYGPYRQSERMQIYQDVASKLYEAGFAYRCYCRADEVEARYEAAKAAVKAQAVAAKEAALAAGADGKAAKAAFQEVWQARVPQPGYDGHCRDLTDAQLAQFADRPYILRFRMPDAQIRWDDLIRGEMSFAAQNVPDFGIVRPNGLPLYTLVNPVDDAMMGITHVLRGEDLLSSTPRQIALYGALAQIGVLVTDMPRFGHLPYVMGEGNKKLSKRDAESSLAMYRESGFLPEALLNYLALLGWSMPANEQTGSGIESELFSMEQMVAAFELDKVNANPARFDLKKCTAINAAWIRRIPVAELQRRLTEFLQDRGTVGQPLSSREDEVLTAVTPLVAERSETLLQAAEMIDFLFVADEDFVIDAAQAEKILDQAAGATLRAARVGLAELSDWCADDISAVLADELVDGLGLKPRLAYGPIRLAVSGKRISPPLFESMEILGKPSSLARLDAALALLPDASPNGR